MLDGNLEGQTLNGRYQVESLIGRGGMASVYKAYDPNLHRTVGIKVIHPQFSNNPDFLRRFEEEATLVAHLRHPNIVQVFDFAHENDLYYMVMEFLAGETLQARLRRLNAANRRMPIKDALHFTENICQALDDAHQRGLIHRDIKPANVMLDLSGKAILMDFGIARILGGSQHTATGAVIGTALYMSPEQIRGLHLDARSDLYSLGVTLFEMLGGRTPFESDSAMTLMMMHLNDPVPDIRELQPDTPTQLVAFLNKSLSKTREERFQSAAEMTGALKQLSAQPGEAPVAPLKPVIPVVMSDATLVEAPPLQKQHATIIEQPAVRPGAGGQTLVEQAVTPPRAVSSQPPAGYQQPALQTAPGYPSTYDQAAYPGKQKGSKTWLAVLLTVLALAVLGAGGFYAFKQGLFQQILGGGAETTVAPIVIVLPTETPSEKLLEEATPTQVVLAEAPALEPSATPEPELIAIEEPSPTSPPQDTPTPVAPPVVIGGADKIAYLDNSNVWVANLDGSDLTQLTQDSAEKHWLRWLPDGQGLLYLSGRCIHTVLLSGEDQEITCFPNSEFLDSLEISPDGALASVSLDHQLYLINFDLQQLADANSHGDLAAMAPCADFAYYKRNFAHLALWSKDSRQWAALALGVLKDGRRGDVATVFAVDRCIPNPLVTVQFPPPFFMYKEYNKNPAIESIAWDGEFNFVFNSPVRNDGFGDLHFFNIDTFKENLYVNPIRDVCCYRDARWSPDGSHLLVVFQDYKQGANSTSQIYLIPFGSIGSGATYEPLPLPIISDPRAKPQPVLRPAP
jgi:eukaryotic-like serine/threonine-protein kinase